MDEYASHARFYDPLVGPFLRSVHAAMLDGLAAGTSLIDVCCGTGLLADMAQKRGFAALGVDLSSAMLKEARTKRPHVPFVLADAAILPWQDNAFDNATISFALHEKPRSVALTILREAVRVVRPGGSVVVADYRLPQHDGSSMTGWAIRLVERMAGKEHHAHFQEYMKAGGTEAFLREATINARCRTSHLNGWCGVYIHTVGSAS